VLKKGKMVRHLHQQEFLRSCWNMAGKKLQKYSQH
jgi:hypothetical protein